MKFFMGSDLFENRARKPVLLEMEVDFEMESESIEEPTDKYHMQLTYRAADTWRVVYTEEGTFSESNHRVRSSAMRNATGAAPLLTTAATSLT